VVRYERFGGPRQKQHVPLKHWYPTTSVHRVRTQRKGIKKSAKIEKRMGRKREVKEEEKKEEGLEYKEEDKD
jgi:hypothetical protein